MGLRRRKLPHDWTLAEIDDAVDAAFVDPADAIEHRATVVVHIPEQRVPRRLLRVQREQHGIGWMDYQWWGFVWTQTDVEYAQMGDSPYGCVQAHNACPRAADARTEARKWIGDDAVEVPYPSTPPFLGTLVRYAVRRGRGSFFPSDGSARPTGPPSDN